MSQPIHVFLELSGIVVSSEKAPRHIEAPSCPGRRLRTPDTSYDKKSVRQPGAQLLAISQPGRTKTSRRKDQPQRMQKKGIKANLYSIFICQQIDLKLDTVLWTLHQRASAPSAVNFHPLKALK